MSKATSDGSHLFIVKADLLDRKTSTDYEEPSIAWILKKIADSKGTRRMRENPPELEVIVWDKEHEPANRGLTQRFDGPSVTKEDLKHAREYAKFVIEQQGALLATISLWMWIPRWGKMKHVYIEDWRPEDLG